MISLFDAKIPGKLSADFFFCLGDISHSPPFISPGTLSESKLAFSMKHGLFWPTKLIFRGSLKIFCPLSTRYLAILAVIFAPPIIFLGGACPSKIPYLGACPQLAISYSSLCPPLTQGLPYSISGMILNKFIVAVTFISIKKWCNSKISILWRLYDLKVDARVCKMSFIYWLTTLSDYLEIIQATTDFDSNFVYLVLGQIFEKSGLNMQ